MTAIDLSTLAVVAPIFASAAARDAAIPTPTKGQLCVITTGTSYPDAPAGLQEYNGAVAGWTPPWNVEWGRIYQAVSAADVAMTTNVETTVVTLGAVTYKANRVYELRASIGMNASGTTTRALCRIHNVTDNLRQNIVDTTGVTTAVSRYNGCYLFKPGAVDRAVEFRISFQNANGTGTCTVVGAAPQGAALTAFDIGPDADPT